MSWAVSGAESRVRGGVLQHLLGTLEDFSRSVDAVTLAMALDASVRAGGTRRTPTQRRRCFGERGHIPVDTCGNSLAALSAPLAACATEGPRACGGDIDAQPAQLGLPCLPSDPPSGRWQPCMHLPLGHAALSPADILAFCAAMPCCALRACSKPWAHVRPCVVHTLSRQ